MRDHLSKLILFLIHYADSFLKIVENEVDYVSFDVEKDPAIGLCFSLAVSVPARSEAFDADDAHIITVL